MQTVLDVDEGRLAQAWLDEALPGREESGPDEPLPALGDLVDISDEAARLSKDALARPLARKALSLESIRGRIAAVKEEILRIWNSPLPDKEKYLQIQSRETEISLLEAGIFEFAKAGFDVSV